MSTISIDAEFTNIVLFPGSVVQRQALARGLLPLRKVSRVAGRQAVRLQARQDLLRQLL